MGNKLNRVITSMINMKELNPIISIHDQGAGGLANVIKEIVYPFGATINLNNVTLGDKQMQPVEIWCSEFQESDVLLINKRHLSILQKSCDVENICLDVLGEVTNTNNIVVYYNNKIIINL